MKAVLIGSDFMYRQDGNLVPIEINTNVAYDYDNRLELEEDVWHFEKLKSFVQSNSIKEIYLEGRLGISTVQTAFIKAFEGIATIHPVANLEEFEKLEDRDDRLLCRNSYSDEAIVDSYCRDKIAFLDLISGTDYASEYLLKESDRVSGEITSIPDNGLYPNFIVKYRYPQYDKSVYPKLFKFDTLEEVRNYAENELKQDYYITQFNYNADKLCLEGESKKIKLIRDWTLYIVKDEKLQSISFGTYSKVCKALDDSKVLYDGKELVADGRDMFLTKNVLNTIVGEVLVEDSDLVLMADGTWQRADTLESGSLVMALNVPVAEGVDIKLHTFDFNVPFEKLQESSSFTSASVNFMTRIEGYIDKVTMKFEDGTDWYDTADSSYTTIDPEDGTVRFTEIGNLEVGNEVVLLDSTDIDNPKYVKKKISSITKERKQVTGYQLSLAGPYIFITREQDNPTAYASIEHNYSTVTLTLMCTDSRCSSCYVGTSNASLAGKNIWIVGSISCKSFAAAGSKGYALNKLLFSDPCTASNSTEYEVDSTLSTGLLGSYKGTAKYLSGKTSC